MRSILLHIDDDDCLEARVQVALDLARAFGAHLSCLQAVPYEFGVPGDIYGTMAAQMLPEFREAADALRARLEPRLVGEDVAWDLEQQDGFASQRILRRCGLSDLVVLGSCEPLSDRGPSTLAGDVVLRARTPVLLVPPRIKSFDCAAAAVVAWDGSAEAARALRCAVPLLARARSVTLVSVTGEKDRGRAELPPIEGAEYLSRHGVGCEMVEVPCTGTVAATLVEAAAAREAGYIVMGAYGRPRLLEVVWGGVTRELFTDPPLPILACH